MSFVATHFGCHDKNTIIFERCDELSQKGLIKIQDIGLAFMII
jgi:hypothetical protein